MLLQKKWCAIVTDNTFDVAFDAVLYLSELTVPAPGVLFNAIDADGDSLAASLVMLPAHGTVELLSSGAFTYTAEPFYTGPDSFSYYAADSLSESTLATIYINVLPYEPEEESPPIAVDDSFNVPFNQTLNRSVITILPNEILSNDIGSTVATLDVIIIDEPLHGILEFAADGTYIYVASADYAGEDSFTYVAVDGGLTSPVATVSLVVFQPQTNPGVLSISDVEFNEGPAFTYPTMTFTVDYVPNGRANLPDTPFEVTWSFRQGETAKDDFALSRFPTGGTLVFFGDKEEHLTASIQLQGDFRHEPNESFYIDLALVGAVSGVVISDSEGACTIINDDNAHGPVGYISVYMTSPTVIENTRDAPLVTDVAIHAVYKGPTLTSGFSVRPRIEHIDTNSNDFVNLPVLFQDLAFAGTDGEIKTFSININPDSFLESDELFGITLEILDVREDVLSLNPPGSPYPATIKADDFVYLTIVPDLGGPYTEGSGKPVDAITSSRTFTVTFFAGTYESGAPVGYEGGFDVNIEIVPTGHAAQHTTAASFADRDDFRLSQRTITFTGVPKQTVTLTVDIHDDTWVEADETFTLALSSPQLDAAVPPQFRVTDGQVDEAIVDNDFATVSIAVLNGAIGENTLELLQMRFLLSRRVDTGIRVRANIKRMPPTTIGVAQRGVDFQTVTTATFIPATKLQSGVNQWQTLDDGVTEGDEIFEVLIVGASANDGFVRNLVIPPVPNTVLTIVDNE